MNNRVVITGLGVTAPNAVGTAAFTEAIINGVSGIRFYKELEDLNFSCCIGGSNSIGCCYTKPCYNYPVVHFLDFIKPEIDPLQTILSSPFLISTAQQSLLNLKYFFLEITVTFSPG